MTNQDLQFNNLQAVLNQYGEQLISLYRQKLLQTNTDATGTLGNTLNYIVETNEGLFELSLRIQDYWKYVEEGRGPGKYPPINDIKNWIRVKPVTPTIYNEKLPTIDQLAYLIARKIHLRGTRGKYLLQASLDELSVFDLLDEAITKDLEIQVNNVFKNF
jgi:hypothetical protein